MSLRVCQIGPAATLQDLGRPGFLAYGLSRGGAMDRLALAEGAALLGNPPESAALEMAGLGGSFEVLSDVRIALTGAPMAAHVDGAPLLWNSSHGLTAGSRLEIGSARSGSYGYLHLGGGIAAPEIMGSRSAHLMCGIGGLVAAGDVLQGEAAEGAVGLTLDPAPRFSGGTLRVVVGPQTGTFGEEVLAAFQAARFKRDMRGNRMGVRMEGPQFQSLAGLSVLSDVIVPGDVQITGDGAPFILLSECQTTGGYPRIGTVLPCDLPRAAQAQPGDPIQFAFVSLDEAVTMEAQARRLKPAVRPLIRDPNDIADLLSYQLVSGVTAGDEA